MKGVFNAVSSEHLTMNDFSQKMLRSFGKKRFFPNIPACLVRMLFGERSDVLLKGSRVSNEKLKKAGFDFWYLSIFQCL